MLGVLLWCAIPKRAAAYSGVLGILAGNSADAPQYFRVATYNIHGARGTDRVKDLSRTAGVIQGADIVALQEVHAGWRSNQAHNLGQKLGSGWLYTPTVRRWCTNQRGNGLLSRYPIKHWQTRLLPNVAGHRYRIFTITEITLGDTVLSLLFTHLHTREGREQQLKIVLDHFANLPVPALLIGDLNTRKNDPVFAQRLPPDCTDAISRTLEEQDSADRVDWILARGLNIGDGGCTPPGVSDHPFYWVEISPVNPTNADPVTTTP